MNYYIADLHFGHKNVLSFDNRPFDNVEDMNKSLIDNWNSVVKNEDNIYIVGDMFWSKETEAIEILKQLNGQKFLIKGNHCRTHSSKFKKYFIKIEDYMEVKDKDRNGNEVNIVLCHYPIPCFKNHYYGWYHFHGHTHQTWEESYVQEIKNIMIIKHNTLCNMFNVGCMIDYMNYTPRTFTEIVEGNK